MLGLGVSATILRPLRSLRSLLFMSRSFMSRPWPADVGPASNCSKYSNWTLSCFAEGLSPPTLPLKIRKQKIAQPVVNSCLLCSPLPSLHDPANDELSGRPHVVSGFLKG